MAFVVSLPRTLSQLSHIGVFSAATMGLAVLLSIIFAGVQKHPSGYILGQEPIVTIIPIKGTTYVAGGSPFTSQGRYGTLISIFRDVSVPEYRIYS